MFATAIRAITYGKKNSFTVCQRDESGEPGADRPKRK
jgi:hypothetical protein